MDGAASLATPEAAGTAAPDMTAYVRAEEGLSRLACMVEGIQCGGCVAKIERALTAEPDVREARVNLSTKRMTVAWDGPPARAGGLAAKVAGLGFKLVPYDPDRIGAGEQAEEKTLLRALAVAGFAAANVMLLSLGIWAGNAQGMAPETRELMHWFSALIALPAISYAGRPFFRSALQVLSKGHTNMDVPISLGVLLAAGMSLHETIVGGHHAYFDSAVTLLFFLLIGRYLDRRARGRARSAAERLLALRAQAVTVLDPDGSRRAVGPEAVMPGDRVLVAAGERVAVDGTVIAGRSDIDTSLITGESVPATADTDTKVFAGTVNLTGALTLRVDAAGDDTLLADIVRLVEAAEQRRARFVSLADRVSRLYAPAVHSLALAAFLGWWLLGGADWQVALLIAVAVLIITCPCALGLAVPAVQVIASGRLMRQGVFLKSATALERLAEVDLVAFDKTGTLTLGQPRLVANPGMDGDALRVAASLASTSKHPLARALAAATPDTGAAEGVVEVPGCGLQKDDIRLGRREWCGVGNASEAVDGSEMWLVRPNAAPVRFGFEDDLRPDAIETVAALKAAGTSVALLSGDREPVVARVAATLGIEDWRAEMRPEEKTARLEAWAREGRRVFMVGDGLNDAPALAAAHISASPSTAADISQTAADAVFQGERLAPVGELLTVACRADRLVKQNFVLAFGYNIVTIPLAMAGFVTPLIAAVCMSSSSIAVVGNALRLGLRR